MPERVLVVGAGLGGLSAAIHLRAAGRDVEVYEADPQVGGRANQIVRQGFTFDTGPSLLNYPWVFEDLFRAAGRDLHDCVTLLRVDPSVAFRWPDGTSLALSSDLSRLFDEFERLEPGSRPRAAAFMRSAHVRYQTAFSRLVTRNEDRYVPWLRAVGARELVRLGLGRSLDADLRRFFRSRHIREALGSYAMYLGGSPYELPAFFSILPYGELAYGLWLPKGGIYALVHAIARVAREIGVTIHTGQRVSAIEVERGAVAGIRLAGGERPRAGIVVSNVDVPTTDTELLSDTAMAAAARRTRMTPGVMTFYWGVRGRLPGATHHTIFLPRDVRGTFRDLLKRRRLPTELAFYLSVPSETDAELAPAGCSSVFVLVPAPLLSDLPGADWQTLASAARGGVLRRLRAERIPLTEDQIEVEEVYTPIEWRRRFGLYDGSAFGAAHMLRQLGPGRAPNASRHVRGLFYAGAGTTPGTGMPMVVLSGKMVASRIAGAA